MIAVKHIVPAAIFLAMAALQLNDPDPTLWVAIYAAVAAAPIARLNSRRSPILLGVATGLVVAGLLVSASGFLSFFEEGDWLALGAEMSDQQPYVEPAREFIGTLMGAVCLAFYWPWHGGNRVTD